MIDLVAVGRIATSCRLGLSVLCGKPGSMFAEFPRGACCPATEIVGRLLKEQLGYDGMYVCGNGRPELTAEQTHAWFEVGNVLVDITYDQFEGTCLSGWLFARDMGWHARFENIERRKGFCMPSDWPCYPYDGYRAALESLNMV